MPEWATLTMDEIGQAAADGRLAILPVGATEQHGSHLPTGTDTLLADQVALRAAERTGDIVLPALAYGCSLGHTDHWPGTLSLLPSTMMGVLMDVVRWAHGSKFRKLVIVNGHATNGPPCQSAILQLRHELPELRLRFVSIFDLTPEIAARYTRDAPDFHANEAETSMLLHLAADQVRPDRVVDEPDRTVGRAFQYDMPSVTRSGVVGAPSEASAPRGAELLDQLVDALAALLTQARAERDPELG